MTEDATRDGIRVRPAELADLDAINSFIAPFVEHGRLLPRTRHELTELIDNGFVAFCDDALAGFAALEVYSPKMAEIRSLAVGSDFQGRGVGRALVRACVERARFLDVFEVLAVTSSEDFFRRCGFEFTLPGEKKAMFLQTRPNFGL